MELSERTNELEAEQDRLIDLRVVLQAQFGRRTRFYHEQGAGAPLGLLLMSRSLPDFIDRVEVLSQVLARDARLARELRQLTEQVKVQQQRVASERLELIALRQRGEEQQASLLAEVARREKILSDLSVEERPVVEAILEEMEESWQTVALPVLGELGVALQSVDLRGLKADAVRLTLIPPGAVVRLEEETLNKFFRQREDLRGMEFQLRPTGVTLTGTYDEMDVVVQGQFLLAGRSTLRFDPREVRVGEYPLPASVLTEMMEAGMLDLDLSPLVGSFALRDLEMEDGWLSVRAGLR